MDSYTRSSRNNFTGYGLDRAHHQLQDADWVACQLRHPDTLFLPVWQMQHLIASDGPSHPVMLAPDVAGVFLSQAESVTVLGLADDRIYVALDLPATEQPPAILTALGQFRSLRQVGSLLGDFDSSILAYTRAMIYWHQQHRFCGVCGTPTESREGGHLRVCTNPQCKQQHFPRTDPAIIVRTTRGDHILLGRQPQWAKGRYSNIAGFVAPGESLEDAVIREVLEETCVRVATVDYHSSQPWPFPSSLMLGFTAEAAEDAAICYTDGELEDVRWFTRVDIRQGLEAGTLGLPSRISISFHLIEDWFDEGDEGHLAELKQRYNPD
jgi:NAD+ diphosphatase